MDLDKEILLQDKTGTSIKLPLRNLLNLTFIYLKALKSEYEVQIANRDVEAMGIVKATLEDFLGWMANKLGLKRGDQVLL